MRKPSLTLKEFYQKTFAPSQSAKFTSRHIHNYATACNRFNEFIRRPALLTDLDERRFADFRIWLVKKGFVHRSAREAAGLLKAIQRFAGMKGIIPFIETGPHRPPWMPPEPLKREEIKTLREFFWHVYLPLRLRGKSESCKRQYIIQLNHFARFLGHEPVFADLQDEIVSEFLNSLVDGGRSPATGNKARNHTLALWRLAARKRFVEEFPEVPRITEPLRIPKAWLESDLTKLWKVLANVPGKIAGIPAGPWWVALHSLLWWSGERIGAILKLRWSDVDLETGWLIVPAQFRKFGLSDKATKLPASAIAALHKIREPERELIFPWDRAYEYLWTIYRDILKQGGLPYDRKSKFHRMRRSAASHFEAKGGNATELLGHSARSVTRGYLDPRVAIPPQAADMLFEPGGAA